MDRSKRALFVLATGADDLETFMTAQVLERGGIRLTMASLMGSEPLQFRRNIFVQPTASLGDSLKGQSYDAIIIPGGVKCTVSSGGVKCTEVQRRNQ